MLPIPAGLMDQVTAVFGVLVTVAANCCAWLWPRVAVAGAILTTRGALQVAGDVPLVTMNSTPLLLWPPVVITTFPVVAPLGTMTATMLGSRVEYPTETVLPPDPSNTTVPLEPKFDPRITVDVPTGPYATAFAP